MTRKEFKAQAKTAYNALHSILTTNVVFEEGERDLLADATDLLAKYKK